MHCAFKRTQLYKASDSLQLLSHFYSLHEERSADDNWEAMVILTSQVLHFTECTDTEELNGNKQRQVSLKHRVLWVPAEMLAIGPMPASNEGETNLVLKIAVRGKVEFEENFSNEARRWIS